MDYEHLLYERSGENVTITLDRADRRNCLSSDVLTELDHALRLSGDDATVAGVILAARGPVFSSGHDLREMAGMDESELHGLFSVCTRAMTAMGEIPKVVVARVHALATAAGCQLVASADLVVAAESAAFATPGGKGGLFCHTPMVAVARQIGRKRAAEMALTGSTIDARTAFDWGLVNRVVPDDELDAATQQLLELATRGSRFSKGVGKQALYAQMELPLDEAYKLAIDWMAKGASEGDGREWPTAFVEKRDAVWTHTH